MHVTHTLENEKATAIISLLERIYSDEFLKEIKCAIIITFLQTTKLVIPDDVQIHFDYKESCNI
jgi:hypothetical protein